MENGIFKQRNHLDAAGVFASRPPYVTGAPTREVPRRAAQRAA
jgi:hypothetical protein